MSAALIAALFLACQGAGSQSPRRPSRPDVSARIPEKGYLRKACDLPDRWVRYLWRGWVPSRARNFDLVLVPTPPNFVGTFTNTSHSGPYAYLQEIPLVFYGPNFVQAGAHELQREVTLADVAPTFAHLMGFEFKTRSSRPLVEIIRPGAPRPKLIFTAVIDGGGNNVLDRWPEAWPNLKRLMENGATVRGAVTGSSPSITPATHANMSTGTFPREHGVSGIAVRADSGVIVGAYSERPGAAAHRTVPDIIQRVPTLADLWDRANDDAAKVAGILNGNYPLGMIGLGAAFNGGDKDILAFPTKGGWTTASDYYSLPNYLRTAGPQAVIDDVDRSDGKADGKWMGHEFAPLHASPAFAPWENRIAKRLMKREGFGRDGITDLVYVNYKAPDSAGHLWNMIAPEQRANLESADRAVGDMVRWLDRHVGRDEYVMLVTADHGQSPLDAGGWAINRAELSRDVNRRFGASDGSNKIVQRSTATSLFIDRSELKVLETSPEQVASFLSRYTIGDNVPDDGEVPREFESRVDEKVFDAVFPGRQLPKIMSCSGARRD